MASEARVASTSTSIEPARQRWEDNYRVCKHQSGPTAHYQVINDSQEQNTINVRTPNLSELNETSLEIG